MRPYLHYVLALLLTACAALPASAEPTAGEWGLILNLSGRQRMLSQKMTKEALLVTADVNADKIRDDLKKTTALFENTLKSLRDGDAELGLPATENSRIVKQLDKVAGIYAELGPIFAAVANGGVLEGDNLQKVASENLSLLKEMNKAVKMYERQAKKVLGGDEAAAVVINLAGKQRMLTQKMTKEALLVQLGVQKDENLLNLRETTALFARTLTGLLDGDADLELPGTQDAAIREQLDKVVQLWARLSPAFNAVLSQGSMDGEQLSTVSIDNVALLREMNKGVGMFQDTVH